MTFLQQLLPDLADFTIDDVMVESDQVTVFAQPQIASTPCPGCNHPSFRYTNYIDIEGLELLYFSYISVSFSVEKRVST